jgi:hypothetical protein
MTYITNNISKGRIYKLFREGKLMENNSKKWWRSRTLLVGVLEIIAGVVTAIAGEISTGGTLTVAGVLTIILRIITKSAIIK